MIRWLLGLLGAGRLWARMQAGEDAGWCSGPVVKLKSGIYDLQIGFRRRHDP